MKFILQFLLISILISFNGYSQRLSNKEIESSITTIATLISTHYISVEKGKKISDYLLKECKSGKFKGINNWKAFDSIITKTLQDFSHDGHLYVRNDQKMVKEILASEPESTSEQSGPDPFHYSPEAVKNNFGFKEVKVLEGNIGYVKLSQINISEKSLPTLFAVMQFVSNTKALIIDLRNNGGGGSEVGAVFESFFLPKDLALLEFKSKNGDLTVVKTVSWLTEKKYENPLFIIVDNRTASAAEAFAFALQNNKRAKIVGQRSAGAANMNSWYVVNGELFVSVSTAGPTLPGTDESWEQKGIQPDYIIEPGEEIDFILNLK